MCFPLRDMKCSTESDESSSALRTVAKILGNANNVERVEVQHKRGELYWRLAINAPCECESCVRQFCPFRSQIKNITYCYTNVLSDDEAFEKAHTFTKNIFQDLQYLQDQCARHGPTIFKRWSKKSYEKRQAILLDLQPDMYLKQWANVRLNEEFHSIHNRECEESGSEGLVIVDNSITYPGWVRRSHRNITLLPYLNVEALKSNPSLFLSLLFNRVKYTPQQYFPYDNSLLDKPFALGAFELSHNQSCIVMHGTDYGRKLTNWTKEAVHALGHVGFPRALLVLEAQATLYGFLKGIVDRLVGGDNADESLNQSQSGKLTHAGPEFPQVELASTFLNQPYSAPPVFDIKKLVSLAESQVSFHADHLENLQTDPLALRRYCALIEDSGLTCDFPKNTQLFFAADRLMKETHVFYTWGWILTEAKKLEAMHGKLQQQIAPGLPLPADYEELLRSFAALLTYISYWQAADIRDMLPYRPGFRAKWVITCGKTERGMTSWKPQRRDQLHDKLSNLFFSDRLDFCLTALAMKDSSENDNVCDDDCSMIFAVLEDHLAKCEKEEAARLDQILYNSFSNFSALEQVRFMVRTHQPQVMDAKHEAGEGKAWDYVRSNLLYQYELKIVKAETFNPEVMSVENENRPLKFRRVPTWASNDTGGQAHFRSGELLGEFLNTPKPSGLRLRQNWLDQDDAQRTAAGRFWEQMRGRHKNALVHLKTKAEDIEYDIRALSFNTTQAHILSVQAYRQDVLTKIAARKAPKPAVISTPVVQRQWSSQTTVKPTAPASKFKPKTRPIEEQLNPLSFDDLPIRAAMQAESIKIAVGKNSLATLECLFPYRDHQERTKQLPWTSFVSALAEAGFDCSTRHGSIYSFEPNKASPWFGKGSVNFHEPHPFNKFDAQDVLRIGKRMNKWFGWNEDTFVLKE